MSESYSWNDAICQKVLKKYKFEKGNIVTDITHVQQTWQKKCAASLVNAGRYVLLQSYSVFGLW